MNIFICQLKIVQVNMLYWNSFGDMSKEFEDYVKIIFWSYNSDLYWQIFEEHSYETQYYIYSKNIVNVACFITPDTALLEGFFFFFQSKYQKYLNIFWNTVFILIRKVICL